jgi:predicted NBD/HSP70 family sugar kinase
MVPVTTGPASAASVRQLNARAVLDRLWRSPLGESITANELIAVTGLTRATVLAVCDDLVGMGWLDEQPSVSIGPSTGRPPRRFAFRSEAAYVVGVDVGDTSIRGAVADLRGQILGRGRRRAGFSEDQRAQRDEVIREVIDESLATARISPDQVLVASFGLAAPVGPSGGTPAPTSGSYWPRMSLDPALVARPSWRPLVNNDANLAALAVGAHGEADPEGTYVVLLAGERFGAGIVADGRLVLGRDGAAGDMHFLTLLNGVESQEGLAARARRLWSSTPVAPSAVSLFEEARAGDPAASAIVRELADRLARVVAALASLLNPEHVVIGGAVADSADQLVEICRERLPTYAQLPPTITASRLGGDIVLLGSIRAGINEIATAALDTLPRSPG